MNKIILPLLITLCFSQYSHTATFCVSNVLEFQSALTTAQSNNQANIIRVLQGTYTLDSTLLFEASGSHDIEISGGWSTVFGIPCNLQLSNNPYDTYLDGNTHRIMRIKPAPLSNITISNLAFVDGYANSGGLGAGLEIFLDSPNDYEGNVSIENNVFYSNSGSFATAVFAHGNKVDFINNLVIENHSTNGSAVLIIIEDNLEGSHFINNTVVDNTSDSTSAMVSGGVRISAGTSTMGYFANNVIWNNDVLDLDIAGTGFYFIYNNDIGVESYNSTSLTLANNISIDPMFGTGFLNATPIRNSPLVDAGRSPVFPIPFPTPFQHDWQLSMNDLDGNDRVDGSNVDIGAYEFINPDIFIDGFEN